MLQKQAAYLLYICYEMKLDMTHMARPPFMLFDPMEKWELKIF